MLHEIFCRFFGACCGGGLIGDRLSGLQGIIGLGGIKEEELGFESYWLGLYGLVKMDHKFLILGLEHPFGS